MIPILLALLGPMAAMPAAAQDAELPIGVDADDGQFDPERNAIHLVGNVRISRGELEVTADEGYAYRAENGFERIELFGAPVRWRTVTEAGGETTGRADRVVYDLIERTVTLTGEAYVEEARGTYSGERLTYDLATEGIDGEGGINMVIQPEVTDPDADPDADPPAGPGTGEPAPGPR
jgi:lipopolysaccharide export system protein LptA